MDVVGGRTGVTAEQLPAHLADQAELHVVDNTLPRGLPNLLQDLLALRIVLLCLPLDAFPSPEVEDHRVRLQPPPPT